MKNTPLLNPQILPKFSDIRIADIVPTIDHLVAENRLAITKLLEQPAYTWENLIYPLETIDERISFAWQIINHLNAVVNSDELRAAYHACLPKITAYATEMSQNKDLYAAVKSLTESADYSKLNSIQKKILTEDLRDFHLSGVDLAPEQKQKLAKLQEELSKLMSKFEDNVLDATQGWTRHVTDVAELGGIPQHALQAAKELAQAKKMSGWLFTLEMPSYLAIMEFADSRDLRREIYTAYVTRASDQGPNAGHWDNTAIIQQIMTVRYEISKILGFNNYAELSLATKTAKSTQDVLNFLFQLAKKSLPKAKQEYAELTEFAAKHHQIYQLEAWDIPYLSEKLRQQRYAISDEELRPYFPEPQVVQGLFKVINILYGVTIKEVSSGNTWHPDARLFAMYDGNDQLIGQFYIDLYARENKRGGAWMEDGRSRRKLTDGSIEVPIAFINCNFSRPIGDQPALFSHEDVLTLFHEFGHGLQQLLSKVDYASASGTQGVPWDVVEFPSQFMENWCWEKPVLDLIAKHYQTGEVIPDSLYQKMIAAKNFRVGMQMLRQLEFALFDFRLHIEFNPKQEQQVQKTLDEIRREITLFPIPEFNRFQHSFAHIFGSSYAAGYYSYKWAEVWSADAFEKFKEDGIFNRATGKSFLNNILEKGSSEDPLVMFKRFRGREPQIQALLKDMGNYTDEAQVTIE